jgi:hypothetical protein
MHLLLNKRILSALIFRLKIIKKFWDKELEGLMKSRQASNRLKRSHDKLRQSDSHVGKLLTDSYMKRKKAHTGKGDNSNAFLR